MSNTFITIKIRIVFLVCFFSLLKMNAGNPYISSGKLGKEMITWDNSLLLPPSGDKVNPGIAGAFSGFIGDNLIIAGGANFPDKAPWDGGDKKWWNTLYSLNVTSENARWEIKQNLLPDALAYGVSIQLPDGMLCIGGCNSVKCSAGVFLLYEKNGQIEVSTDWPSLPVPLANATGALLNNKVYIAGGQESMEKQEATLHFYVLDLANRDKGWQTLPAWPGKPRGYAVSAVQCNGTDNCFYLFSGRDYNADGYIEVLTDGFVYNPRINAWHKLTGRFPVMAGTAMAIQDDSILFFGGVPRLVPGSDKHPGFDNTVRIYHTMKDSLSEVETAPYPIAVTTNIARKNNVFYIASGEIKPGIRTPYILKGKMHMQD